MRSRVKIGRWAALWVAVVITAATVLGGFDTAAQNTEQIAEALRGQTRSAQREQERLRARIAALQSQIEAREAARRDASDALRASERALSDLHRQLSKLKQAIAQARTELSALQRDIAQQTQMLAAQQAALAQQLRAQYTTGLSPWTALLAGENPQALGRQLAYLDYVSRARARDVEALRRATARLTSLHDQARVQNDTLQRLHADTIQRQNEEAAQQRAHATVLARLDGQLQAQRAESQRLARDDERLSYLLTELARQIEQLRLEATQDAPQNANHAQRDNSSATRATQTVSPSAQRPLPSAVVPPATGLAKLPRPVAGRVTAPFGSAQPGGGQWRGIVLQAPVGAPVKAVADGTVVYGDWLRGFGNLLIIDHGAEWLSVYAYNQSLLKTVGDAVRAGDVVATVGATGGQVESGLYFEIRHQGAPQDPAKLFAR